MRRRSRPRKSCKFQSYYTKNTFLISFSLDQQKDEIDAEGIKADTQAAVDTLQDLQSQFEAVSIAIAVMNLDLNHRGR